MPLEVLAGMQRLFGPRLQTSRKGGEVGWPVELNRDARLDQWMTMTGESLPIRGRILNFRAAIHGYRQSVPLSLKSQIDHTVATEVSLKV